MNCCGSLFVNLGGGGGSVADGVLQTPAALTNSLQIVKDNLGNNSAAQLSKLGFRVNDGTNDIIDFVSAQIRAYRTTEIGAGSLTNNGFVTFKGAGGNIVSFRDSNNVEVAYCPNNGGFFAQNFTAAGNGIFDGASLYRSIDTGSINIYNGGSAVAGIEIYGSANATTFLRNKILAKTDFIGLGAINNANYPAFAISNTPAAIAAKDSTNTNLIPFSAEDFTSDDLSSGSLTTAQPMRFGDKAVVTTGNDLNLDAQIAVEHNGQVYYIPCSTILLT